MSEDDAGVRPYEKLLEESADDLYENAPCGYLSALADGTIVNVNGTFLSWTGYARDDLVGRRRVSDLLAPGDRIYYETHYAPLLLMQDAVREIAVDVVRADGRRLPVLVNSVLRRDDAGNPVVVRTTVFDATDRRRYERELLRARREAEDRARAALAVAHVNEGVLLLDPDGRVQLLNPAGEAILGVAAEKIVGVPVAEAIPAWGEIAGAIPVGGPDASPRPATLPFAAAARETWIAVAGVDSGDGVVYTIRDAGVERRLDELRSEIVAVVSHELRTPLAGIAGAAQTLLGREEALADDLRVRLLEVIVEQSRRQERILDEIVLASRLDEGTLEAREEAADVRELAEAAARRLRAGRSRIEIDLGEGVRVRADAAMAEQLLVCLLDNALKYSDGPVRIAAASAGRRARLTVSDEGPGIPPGERELVFEKFYRLDPEQRGGVAGIGLGLYIARELAARMRGRIGLLPAERGATFFVELPLA